MKVFFNNPHSVESLDDKEAEYSLSEVAQLLSQLNQPSVSLITTMPSGLGLDFYSEDDGRIWIEFYGDTIEWTWVDLSTAQKILDRAYESKSVLPIRKPFADLVQNWGS